MDAGVDTLQKALHRHEVVAPGADSLVDRPAGADRHGVPFAPGHAGELPGEVGGRRRALAGPKEL